jgi:hypothetical protein
MLIPEKSEFSGKIYKYQLIPSLVGPYQWFSHIDAMSIV